LNNEGTKMKKILLVQPNMKVATSGQRIGYPPIGIMYLASVLEKKGYEVEILDCQTEGLDKGAEVIDGYGEGGIPIDEIAGRITASRPDLVGITCNFSVMVLHMDEAARLVKNLFPSVPVVAGGNHPTSLPEEVMGEGAIDYVIMGEGEISFPRLIEAIVEGKGFESVPGLVWRRDGAIIKNKTGALIHDLDSLPYPAWHLFPYEKYSRHYKPRAVTWGEAQAMPSVLTTRGCAGGCVFCSVHKTMGSKFRARKLDDVFKEIRFLVDTYKIKKLMIIDDNFTHNKNRAKEFCDEFKKQGLDIELHFMVLALWCMDEELIDKLKSIGCASMGFAIESGVQDILTNVVKKPLKLVRAMELLKYARSQGIHLTGTFVIGFPGETKRDIRRSLYMANYSGLFDSREIYIATPLPGSALFEQCVREGLLAEGFSYSKVEVVKPNIKTKDFSPDFITTILEADRTHHLIKTNPRRTLRLVRDVWRRRREHFLPVLYETSKMFVKYDFLKIREEYP